MDNQKNIFSDNHDSFFDDDYKDESLGNLVKIHAFSLCYTDSHDNVNFDDHFIPVTEIVGIVTKSEGVFTQIIDINKNQKIWADTDNIKEVK